jgi:hypothetical protein
MARLPDVGEDSAFMWIVVHRYDDGRVAFNVHAEAPGTEAYDRKLQADSYNLDEVGEWLSEFHNESKTWRSLMECVAHDLCNVHLSAF